jgi:hypothetical protein
VGALDYDVEVSKPAEARSLEAGAIGQIAMTAGMGATAGNVFYSWLFGPEGVTHWTEARGATELLGISLSVFFVMRYWEPWIAGMRAKAGLPEHALSLHILRLRLQGFIAILLIILGNEVLQHMAREDAVGAVASFFSPFIITYAWVLGAQQRPSQAALYGTLAAFLLGLGVYWEGLVSLGISWGELPSIAELRLILYSVALTVLYGSVVGLAIDRRWGRHVQWTAMLIIVGGQVLFGIILLPLIEARFLNAGQFDWRGAILALMKAFGWGLGLALFTPTDLALNRPQVDPPPWAIVRGRSLKAILIVALILVIAVIYPTSQNIQSAQRKQETIANTKIEHLEPGEVGEAISFGNSRPLTAADIVDEGDPHRMEFKDFGFAIVFTPWLAIADQAHVFRLHTGLFATEARINAEAIVSDTAGSLTIRVLGKAAQKDFWRAADGEIRQGSTAIRPVTLVARTLRPAECSGLSFACYEGEISFTFPTEELDRRRPADFIMVVQGKRYQSTINLPGLR